MQMKSILLLYITLQTLLWSWFIITNQYQKCIEVDAEHQVHFVIAVSVFYLYYLIALTIDEYTKNK